MRHGAMALLLLVMSGCVLEEASDKGVEYVGPPSNWALGTFHLSAPEAPGWAVNLTIRADGRFYVSSYHCRDLVETLGQADRPVTSYGRADALSNGHVGLQDDDYHDQRLMHWPLVVGASASWGPLVFMIWEWQVAFFQRDGEFFSDGTHTPEMRWLPGEVCSACAADGSVSLEPCSGDTPHTRNNPLP